MAISNNFVVATSSSHCGYDSFDNSKTNKVVVKQDDKLFHVLPLKYFGVDDQEMYLRSYQVKK